MVGLLSDCAELLRIHTANYLVDMGCCQVGVPLRHFGGLVPQHFADRQKAGSVHGKVAGCCVPEVVEAKFIDASSLQCGTPRFAKVDGLIFVRCTGENKSAQGLGMLTVKQRCFALPQ